MNRIARCAYARDAASHQPHTRTTTFNPPSILSRGTNSLSYEYDEAHARTVELANVSTGTQRTVYIGGQFFEVITCTAPGATTTTREYKHYISSPDGVIAVLSTTDTSTNNTGTSTGADMSNGQLKYWLKDHLGSVYGEFAASSPTTTIERLSFDARGQRSGLRTFTREHQCSLVQSSSKNF